MRRCAKILPAVLFAAYLMLVTVPAMAAQPESQSSAAINRAEIVVDKPLEPGQTLELPPIGVINIGRTRASYGMQLGPRIRDQKELSPEASWVSFSPNEMSLKPKEAMSVRPWLSIPLNAEPGKYFALLQAYAKAETTGGASSVSAAAATKLEFEVVENSLLRALWNRFLAYAPWSFIAVGLVILALLFLLLRKRYGFKLRLPFEVNKRADGQ